MLSEHALITAYVEELRPIPPHIVDGIAQEFDLTSLLHAIPGDAEIFFNSAAGEVKPNISAAVSVSPAAAKEGAMTRIYDSLKRQRLKTGSAPD